MKIFCVDTGCEEQPQFYSKSETAQIRNNEPLYIPFFCEELMAEFAFAVKINRVTKAISPTFASRCWDEFSVVTNFWSDDLARKQRAMGAPQEIAYSFDRSFALENDFHPREMLSDTISLFAHVNGVCCETLQWSEVANDVDRVIAHLSSYITLKIGDVVMIKHKKRTPLNVTIGDRIEIKLENETIVETIIK